MAERFSNINQTEITCPLSREQNKLVRRMLDNEMASYKNWIVGAVEAGDFDRAKTLVKELREHQAMCHLFIPDDMWDHHNRERA